MDRTIVCLYKKPNGFRGRTYDASWVERLRRMCARRVSGSWGFTILTDSMIEVMEAVRGPASFVSLKHGWPGWWSKLELFRPDIDLRGRVLYLDLDTLVMQDLDPVFDWPGELGICNAIGPKHMDRLEDGKMTYCQFNSSMMTWTAGMTIPYDMFQPSDMDRFRGDQDFLTELHRTLDRPKIQTYPSSWVTKVRFCPDKGNKPDPKAKVILAMPGKNEVLAKRHAWVREAWVC